MTSKAQPAFGFDRLKCDRLLGLVEPRYAASTGALCKLGMRHLKDVAELERPVRCVYLIEPAEWHGRSTELRA